jgi:hypothetical protein
MCFSAKASFIAATALTACGVASLKKTQKHAFKPLAMIPLLFAVQQLLEGIVWITINNHDADSIMHGVAVYGFLFFSSMFWPIYVPWALYIAEPRSSEASSDRPSSTPLSLTEETPPARRSFKRRLGKNTLVGRKFWLVELTLLGSLVSLMSFLSLVFVGIKATAIGHHVVYDFATTAPVASMLYNLFMFFYVIAIVGAFFISSIPHMWILGICALLSFFAAKILYALAFGSIWCFAAAVGSPALCAILWYQQKNDTNYNLPT